MIQSFRGRAAEELWTPGRSRKLDSTILRVALRKLTMLHAAHELRDLKVPPGNRLEPLSGDRRGEHSIGINDQWRVCFVWSPAGPTDVEITDYH